ncbi:MAG: alanine racemase [Cellulophaga sp.]
MPNATETVLEISLKKLAHNFRYLKSKTVGTDTKFMAVIKAYAYGSESVEIAKKLETLKVDYFAVAYTQEGEKLRKAGIATPIIVLHPQTVNLNTLVTLKLEPSLYSEKILETFIEIAEKHNLKEYPVHLKFNTGLNRLGFQKEKITNISKKLKTNTTIKVASIFSHLAASEDKKEKEFTENQIEMFTEISKEITKQLGYAPMKHLVNTSGIINYPNAHFDMVRSGIGLYGFGNDAKVDGLLKPIATLKTIISQIHKIGPNESVGYNRAYNAGECKISATLPIGHADGIRRQYGNGKASVMVNGKLAPLIGNVCMDMIMVDITGISCKEGDEVILFGEHLSAEVFASKGNTISYELLTGISQRVKRILIN